MEKMLVADIILFLIGGLHCCLSGGAKEDRLLEKMMQDEGSVNQIMKKSNPFLWLNRLYFTYGNPVKAKFNGLSARP